MTEQLIVKESIAEIFRKNGYASINNATQRDFEFIAAEIEKQSGVVISSTTIKRLANGEFSRMPQIATLNAVAVYHGFSNWQDYKSSLKNHTVSPGPNAVKANSTTRWRPLIYLLAVLVLIIITGFYFFYSNKRIAMHPELSTFSATRTTNNELPNTVVFNYDVEKVNADSFFIQQSWDANRRVRVPKNNHTLTDIYYEPGFHIAKLIANDSIIKALEVAIPTRGWFFYAKDKSPAYVPEYIRDENTVTGGRLGLSISSLQANNIDVKKEKEFVYCYFPEKLSVNSDNFRLRTRIRMKEVAANFCPYITVEIFCQRYFIVAKAYNKNCASESFLQFGEKVISGKEADLSKVSFDVTKWTEVEIMVENKTATISVNGVKQFTTNYNQTAKMITGLAFMSNGLCEVDYIDISGLDGEVFYQQDF